jgi:hypothetical protein
MSEALDDPDYVASTRGAAIPPEEPAAPARRQRVARPTVDDNPAAPAEDHRPEPAEAIEAMARRAQAAEDRAAALERQRETWQRERDELGTKSREAENRGHSAERRALDTEISATERQIAAARARARSAREAGDLDAEDAANDERIEAVARKQLLMRDKAAWDEWERGQVAEAEAAKTRKPADAAPPQQQQRQTGPGAQLSPSDRAWADKHPDFDTDEDCKAFIFGAATRAINEGIRGGSPAFYRELDRTYDRYQRLKALEDGGGEQQAQQPRQEPARRRAEPSEASMAPSPSRGNGNGSGSGRQRGVTPEAVARRLNVTVDELRSFVPRGSTLEKYAQIQAQELGMN